MIVFDEVSYAYEPGKPVCEGLGLEISRGLTLLLGPNGAGKSTLLKLAAGVEMPDKGKILVDGHDLWKEEAASRRRLAYLPEYPDLTPYARLDEILHLVCRLRGRPAAEARGALEFFELRDVAHLTVRQLSLGQRRRAVFAAAMVGTPENVLLDEPLDGMDRAVQPKILEWITERIGQGGLVIVVSHVVEPFVDLATALITMREGKARLRRDLPREPGERFSLIDEAARGL